MKLRDLMKLIIESDSEDWQKITCWGYRSAPSYKYRIEGGKSKPGDELWLGIDQHGEYAVFKEDVRITMAWGLSCNDDFKADWANNFTKTLAHSQYVDVFYNGALVFRDIYVGVDESRAYLPVPKSESDLRTPRGYSHFVRLIDQLTHKSTFDDYLRMAGIIEVDEPWPERV